jgi:L-amino acid N-acyltransferase
LDALDILNTAASPPALSCRSDPGQNGPMVVRQARRDDVAMITEIYNDAVLHSTASWDLEPVSLQDRLDWFGMKMAGQWPVLVAEENGEVAGWGSFGPFRDRPGYRHTVEHSVYVRKDQQRRGIGSTLISALVSEGQRRGFHAMLGGVSADNTAGIAFHETHGFVAVARLPEVGRKFDRWLDLVLLQRLLDEDQHGQDSA